MDDNLQRLYLSDKPFQLLLQIADTYSFDDFINLGKSFANEYGGFSAEPWLIPRGNLISMSQIIQSNEYIEVPHDFMIEVTKRWLVDYSTGTIYDLYKGRSLTIPYPDISNLSDISDLSDIVPLYELQFMTDDANLLYRIPFHYHYSRLLSRRNRITTIGFAASEKFQLIHVTDLPFHPSSTSDIDYSSIKPIINLQGKYFILTDSLHMRLFKWDGNQLVRESFIDPNTDRIQYIKFNINLELYSLFKQLPDWLPILDWNKIIANHSSKVVVSESILKITDDQKYLIIIRTRTDRNTFLSISDITTSNLLKKINIGDQPVSSIDQYGPNHLVLKSTGYDLILDLSNLIISSPLIKQPMVSNIYRLIDVVPTVILTVPLYSIFKLNDNMVIIYPEWPIMNPTPIQLLTADGQLFHTINDVTAISLNLATSKMNVITNELSPGMVKIISLGWVYITKQNILIYNKFNGAMEFFGFGGIPLYSGESFYQRGLEDVYWLNKKTPMEQLPPETKFEILLHMDMDSLTNVCFSHKSILDLCLDPYLGRLRKWTNAEYNSFYLKLLLQCNNQICKDHQQIIMTKLNSDTQFITSYRHMKRHGTFIFDRSNVDTDNILEVLAYTIEINFNDPFNHIPILESFTSLKMVTFNKKFNQLINRLPESLTTLIFSHSSYFNKSLDNLPSSLETIIFQYGSSFNLLIDRLPAGLKRLVFNGSAAFNQPVNNLSVGLTHLAINGKFNQVIDKLPVSLINLTLGIGYLRPTDLRYLVNLTDLTFGKNYNTNIDKLPIGLLHLTLGRSFNIPLVGLPVSLTHLRFTRGSNFNLPIDLKYLINLTTLVFGKLFKQQLYKLPISLNTLKLGGDFNRTIDLRYLPNLNDLTLSGSFNRSVDNLPSGLKYLRLTGNFNMSIAKLPSSLEHLNIMSSLFGRLLDISHLHNLTHLRYFPSLYNRTGMHLISKLPKLTHFITGEPLNMSFLPKNIIYLEINTSQIYIIELIPDTIEVLIIYSSNFPKFERVPKNLKRLTIPHNYYYLAELLAILPPTVEVKYI